MTKNKRQIQAEKTRELIYNTSIKAFKEKGFHNVSVDEICAEAGVSKGSFYVHFNSKEDVARIEHAKQRDISIQEAISKQKDTYSPSMQLENILNTYLKFAKESGKEKVLLSMQLSISSKNYSLGEMKSDRTFLPWILQIFERGQQCGDFSNKLTYEQFLFMFDQFVTGIYITWCTSTTEYDIVEIGEVCVPRFIKSLQ